MDTIQNTIQVYSQNDIHFINTIKEIRDLLFNEIINESKNNSMTITGESLIMLLKEVYIFIDKVDKIRDALINHDKIEYLTDSNKSLQIQFFDKFNKLLIDWIQHFKTKSISDKNTRFLDELFNMMPQLQIKSYVSNGQVNMDRDAIKILTKKTSRHSFVKVISNLIFTKTITFPFKRYYMKKPDILMKNLIEHKMKEIVKSYTIPNVKFNSALFPFNFEGVDLLFESEDDDYENIDVICDYFQEEQRLKAKRADQDKSVWNQWQEYSFIEKIVKLLVDNDMPSELNSFNLRETIYKNVKECTQFKPSLYLALIKKFNAKKILDFSAGWGDRLIGAIAGDVDLYIACDPNINLKSGHDAIIDYFKKDREKYKVIYSPFQTAKIDHEIKFDLICTSPPFFDFEIYTNQPGQSAIDFPKYNDWMIDFMFTSLAKSWMHLEDNGILAIHITDVYKTRVCEAINLFMEIFLDGAKYLGVICSTGKAGKPRPIWIWKKTDFLDPLRIKEAVNVFKTIYPDLFSSLDHNLPRLLLDYPHLRRHPYQN